MTNPEKPVKQLELPMLVDVNAKGHITSTVKSSLPHDQNSQSLIKATPQDQSIYEAITNNYFLSIKKA